MREYCFSRVSPPSDDIPAQTGATKIKIAQVVELVVEAVKCGMSTSCCAELSSRAVASRVVTCLISTVRYQATTHCRIAGVYGGLCGMVNVSLDAGTPEEHECTRRGKGSISSGVSSSCHYGRSIGHECTIHEHAFACFAPSRFGPFYVRVKAPPKRIYNF